MTEFAEGAELAAELALETSEVDERTPVRAAAWHRTAAFATLILAIGAALSALSAGMTASTILIDRIEEVINVTEFEGDQVRADLLSVKHDLQLGMGIAPDAAEVAEVEALRSAAEAEARDAQRAEEGAIGAESVHLTFAIAATLFAIGIAVTGMSVIVSQRWLIFAGAFFGVAALAVGVFGVTRLFQ
jgi:hypothetical protein